jgi:DNA-binding transcriptional MerR regulator
MAGMTIGELAKKAGVSVATIRFYEERGLLRHVDRLPNGRRSFDGADLTSLRFIVGCRDAGMSLDDICELISLRERHAQPCVEVQQIVEMRLVEIRERIASLNSVAESLGSLVRQCSPSRCGPAPADCIVFRGRPA